MPAYMWITAAALVALAVFVALGRRWWRVRWVLDWLLVLSPHRWWYSWTAAAHVIELTEGEAGPGREYGSMAYDAELDYRARAGFLPAPPVPPVDPDPWLTRRACPCGKPLDHAEFCYDSAPDWREQTAADLAPEALDVSHEVVLPDAGGWISGPCLDLDGGPTVSGPEGAEGANAPAVPAGPGGDALSLAPSSPGPDQDSVCNAMAPRVAARTEREQVPGGRGQLRDAAAPAAGGAAPPSRWLAEQLEVLRAWSEWQQQKARILA